MAGADHDKGISRSVSETAGDLAALRLSEEKFRKAFHSNSAAIALIGLPTGLVLEVNEAWLSVFGFSRDEAIGKTTLEIGIWPDAGRRQVVLDEFVRRGRFRGREETLCRKSGERFPARLSVSPIEWAGRDAAVVTFDDVTERRRVEVALQESEERFRSVLSSSRDFLYRVDLRTGIYDFISPSVEPMTGFTPEELMGVPRDAFFPLVHADDLPLLKEAIRVTLDTGQAEAEYRQRTKAGEYRRLSNYMVLVRDADGTSLYRIGNIRDVTAQREAEAALRENEVERVAQEERSRLARDLHDSVTQALFAASLKAEALTVACCDQESVVMAAAEEVRRLSRGALAEMRTMLLELRGDPVDEIPLQQLLQNLVEAAESRASVVVLLTLEPSPVLPPPVHEAVYRITQEALNNVIRHARAQHVWVRLDSDGSDTRLVIRDDGCGFDPDAVGAGHLGLKSMQERADVSRGLLSIDTVSGEGTRVTVEWRNEDRVS